MPASSTSPPNIWRSESILMPTRNKMDMADQMKDLQRKIVSIDRHKEAQPKVEKPPTKKTTCLCSPTTHPGSFRCRLHRSVQGRHHPFSTAKESNGLDVPNLNLKCAGNGHDVPNLNLKCAGNLSPSKLSRFCS